jgi:hypothetical protein
MSCCRTKEPDYYEAAADFEQSKGVVDGIPSHKAPAQPAKASSSEWKESEVAAQTAARKVAGDKAEANSPRSNYKRDHVGPPRKLQTEYDKFLAGERPAQSSGELSPTSRAIQIQRQIHPQARTVVPATQVFDSQVHSRITTTGHVASAPAPPATEIVQRTTLEYMSPRGRGRELSRHTQQYSTQYQQTYDSTIHQHRSGQMYHDFHAHQRLYDERGSARFVEGASPRHTNHSSANAVRYDVTEQVSPRHSVRRAAEVRTTEYVVRQQEQPVIRYDPPQIPDPPVQVVRPAPAVLPLGSRHETNTRLSPRSQRRKSWAEPTPVAPAPVQPAPKTMAQAVPKPKPVESSGFGCCGTKDKEAEAYQQASTFAQAGAKEATR